MIIFFFRTQHFPADKAIHNLQFLITNNKYSNQGYVIKTINHWYTGIYQESDNRCEIYHDFDLNCLAPEILGNILL